MTRARRKPLDQDLYEEVVEEAKRKFAVWPSAYASGWVVKTYKERGGRYAGQMRAERTGLTKWFGEKWVDLSRPIHDENGELVGYEPCGRKKSDDPADYPKCRPLKEAMRMTPAEVKDAIRRKRRAEASSPGRGSRARPPKRVATYKKNPEVIAAGDCFRFATQTSKKIAKERGLPLDTDAVAVVHGMVKNAQPQQGERPWYEHAWVEYAGKAYDWQTEYFGRPVLSVSDFYALYTPTQTARYTPEQAMILGLHTGHHGPWHEMAYRNPVGQDKRLAYAKDREDGPGPDELQIVQVDGEKIRRDVDVDFTMGGNPSRYAYVPQGELWVEDNLSVPDTISTIVHESIEHRLMKNRGLSYDDAHEAANEVDADVRSAVDAALSRARRNPEGTAPSVPQTQTEAFRRWFGDSKVVDENGEPLVVYHGTDKGGFFAFDMSAADRYRPNMMFFTNDYNMARSYTRGRDDPTPPYFLTVEDFLEHVRKAGRHGSWEVKKEYYVLSDEDETRYSDLDDLHEAWEDVTEGDIGVIYTVWGPDGYKIDSYNSADEDQMRDLLSDVNSSRIDEVGVYEVYLRIVDPWIVDAKGANWDEIPVDEEDEDGNPVVMHYTTNRLALMARDMDHDGLIIRNVYDAGRYGYGGESGDLYVVFDDKQIKSASHNIGTFDPADDDIRRNPPRRARRRGR